MSSITTSQNKKIYQTQYQGLPWIGNAGAGGALYYCLDMRKTDQFTVHVLYKKVDPLKGDNCPRSGQTPDKNKRLWANITFAQIEHLLQSNIGLYEVIAPELKRKVYFDIDAKEGSSTLEQFKTVILEKFPDANIQVSGQHNILGDLGSYHIVLSNYFFKNQEEQSAFAKVWCPRYKIDGSVYTKNRNMKCVNQSKPDRYVQQILEGSQVPTKHLILCDFDEDAKDAYGLFHVERVELESMVSATSNKSRKRKRFYSPYAVLDIYDDELDFIRETWSDLECATFGSPQREGNLIIIPIVDLICPSGIPHKSNHSYFVVGTNTIIWRCHDEVCKENKIEKSAHISSTNFSFFKNKHNIPLMDIYSNLTDEVLSHHFHLLADDCALWDTKTKDWFWFNGTRWENNGEHNIQRFLNDIVYPTLEDCLEKSVCVLSEATTTDAEKKELGKKHSSALSALRSKIQNNTGISKFCSFLRNSCVRKDLLFDTNPYLLGFDNGVFDFSMGEFRKINRDDYLTMSVGYDFPEEIDEQRRAEVLGFIKAMFDDETFDYMMLTFAKSLCGRIHDEEFFMWTGTGSNGKSKLVALLKKTFGAYLYNISPAEIVSGVKAGAPEPQLDGCRGRRLVFTCEPDKNCSFNSSSIKRWTGNGELLNTRDVYKGTTEWTAQFRLFSVSNEIPRMSTVDDAIVRRARVIPFLYQFVQSPLNAIDRKADYEASGHFDSWKSDLMLYLLEKYREYSALECKKVALPTRCQTETDTYFDTTNPIKDTFNEVFNLVDDKNVFLSWGEITGAYYTHKRLQGDYTRFDDHCFQSYVRDLNGLKERRDKKNVNGASVRGFWGIVVREKPPAFVLDDK